MDVRQVVQEQGAAQQGLATLRQLEQAGLSRAGLSGAVAAGRVVRVHRAVYALAPLPSLPRHLVTEHGTAPELVARARAALLALGPRAVATGRTAAVLRGWSLLVEPRQEVEVAVPHGRCARLPGVRVRQRRRLDREEVQPLLHAAAVPVASAVRTVLDAAAELPLLQGVVLCDSALRSGQVTLDELEVAALRLPGERGAARARRVVELADPLSGSVLETVFRVRVHAAGLRDYRTQLLVRDRPALRTDGAFLDAGLVVELDGARWHQEPARDRRRDNALAALGWRVLRFTWAEVLHDWEAVLEEVRAARVVRTPSIHLVGSGGPVPVLGRLAA